MSEAFILAAFYQPKSRRFVPLTREEFQQRSGFMPGHPDAMSLIARHIIKREKPPGMQTDEWIYSLSIKGEARVRQMAETGALPKVARLTGKPKGGAA